ncbi:MAG: energy transducer TonB [Chthoniobacteraceae bacterium]
MNPVTAQDRNMTFAWEPPSRQRRALAWFIGLSLLAHIATFFLFQVVYPERATIPAPAPSLSILDASRPDHQTLLRLIEAEDPAPAAATHAVVPPQLLDVPYRPSYATPRTPPRNVVEPQTAAGYPPALDPVALIREITPGSNTTPAPASPVPSQVRFRGALADRKRRHQPALSIRTERKELQPATFLIGVQATGEVTYAFLQQSSGDAAVDEAASQMLRAFQFEPSSDDLVWGYASINWGNDVYTAPAKTP